MARATRSKLTPDKLQARLLETTLDTLGVTSSFDQMLAFERKSGFLYTRMKGRYRLGYVPNLEAPRSFNEKCIHRRLFSRDPIWPIVTNKVHVRTWLQQRGLDQGFHFVPVLHVIDDPARFDFRQLNEPVVIKAAWGSTLNVFVRDPSGEDWESVRAKLIEWQAAAYFPKRLIWAETQMKRVFVVERLYANAPGAMLDDYKFSVFHGRVELLLILSGRGSQLVVDYYDRDLNRLSVAGPGYRARNPELPQRVQAMLPLVERIGEAFDFVRVDMYYLNDQILFGEITQCPANGFGAFTPTSFDFELGEKWRYDSARVYEDFTSREPATAKSARLAIVPPHLHSHLQ